MSAKKTHITVGSGKSEERFSIKFLKGIGLDEFLRLHSHSDDNRLINVWKQANGLTKPNRSKKSED
jgi:hypothetical protein